MKTATFNRAMRWIIMGSLLLAAACGGGGYYQPYGPAPAPYYNYQYYPDYYGPSYYPEQDPQYWQMWQDRQGAG
jgi:hypothetical protein